MDYELTKQICDECGVKHTYMGKTPKGDNYWTLNCECKECGECKKKTMEKDLIKQLIYSGFKECRVNGHECECPQHGNCLEFVAPTLSELIEACGSSFRKLIAPFKTKEGAEMVTWMAVGEKEGVFQIGGSTPEEAVARLWLELNKK